MQTQEQQEQKYGFYIHSTMEVEEDKEGNLRKNLGTGHFSMEIAVPGKETICIGYFPEKDSKNINAFKSLFVRVNGEYRKDDKRIKLAGEWDDLYPND